MGISLCSISRADAPTEDGGRLHCRAICTPFLKGYSFSLDVSTASPEKGEDLVAKAITFKRRLDETLFLFALAGGLPSRIWIQV